ncbi:hypothetical protein DPSP01_009620 [Paraphaeosphaeria sporulosa]|uniref:Tat pathway signal sequence n=1 Tax=Paraphaeosphaeria sporulosa TaxID=1460663 RepID=A0A177CYH0_9PLEO|nr:uncharacterized protein CC84DRAFT_1134048 [Paraphaeosphaeria sporulosa]OAG11897.1 hypothetical protein CC84DRAFT_1134048 [Paraphaeosphaeria sporulosa]
MHEHTYEAPFFNSPYSIYRGPPSPEVDAAWEAIEYPAQMHFSREEIIKLGKDPEAAAKLPEEWGYGADRYFGVLDGQHLIHCVNLLRQWSHFDYYFPKYTPQSQAPPLASAHKDHCVAVLLEHLTCQPSLNVFTYYWMEGQPDPYPNFEINRKCQNHRDLLEWQREREVAPEFRELSFERPEGAKVRPADPRLAMVEGWVWNGSAPI